MDNNLKYLIYVIAGFALYYVAGPAIEMLNGIFDNLGMRIYIFYSLLRLIMFLMRLVGLATVITFTMKIIISAWKELRMK